MRVTHIISGIDASLGGPVSALMGLARAQVADGMDVSVVAMLHSDQIPPAVEQLRKSSVQVVTIGPTHYPIGWHPSTPGVLRPVIASSDVVHIHALWEDLQHQAARLSRELGKPYIFRPCGMLDEWAMKRSRLKKRLYMLLRLKGDLNDAAAIHVSTAWEHDQTATLGLRAPLIVAPNGVELAEFEDLPPAGAFRAKHPQLSGRPVIVFLGRVFPGKGVEMLIPALARMKQSQAMLAVVGPDSGGYEGQMRALAEQEGVRDRVVFAGMARGRERIEALVDADLFGLPSEHENFGVAVLEAMAAGTPVIVSDQVGLYREIEAAKAGEAVPLRVDRLAAAMDSWMADEPRRREAGIRAREMVFDRFSWQRIARDWIGYYDRMKQR